MKTTALALVIFVAAPALTGCGELARALPGVPGMPSEATRALSAIPGECDIPLPDLTGLTRDEAAERLADGGKRNDIDWRERRCDATIAPGRVCATAPPAGQQTCPTTPVVVYVQSAPPAESEEKRPAASAAAKSPSDETTAESPRPPQTSKTTPAAKKAPPPPERPADFF